VSTETARRGVLYDVHDYVPFWRRVIISIVDILVIIVTGIVLAVVFAVFTDATDEQLDVMIPSVFLLVSLGYLVVLKRSRLRTVGYRLFDARIVTLAGTRPGVWQMVQRLGFGILGPANYVLDLVWITQDDTRQSLRDKWAGTYVVRAAAEPRAEGRIVSRMHNFMGFSALFDEVTERG